MKPITRCPWANTNPEFFEYHDQEWGVPVHDDRLLFEMLILEGAQAGLSWLTVLRKRQNYRQLFDNFDVKKIAAYSDEKLEQILKSNGIIRNRLKVFGTRKNALSFLNIQDEYGSFDEFIWQFTGGKQVINHPKTMREIATTTAQSDRMSKELKKRNFTFVGSTICYAYMQAIGMVVDHTQDYFRYSALPRQS